MRLLLLHALIPFVLSAQEEEAIAQLSQPVQKDSLSDTIPPVVEKDTVNVLDAAGKKQGYWLFLGGDFPNSGVGASDKLEDGYYIDNERIGIWTRYDAKGMIKATMRYSVNPKTKVGTRDQFYPYSYHPNGVIQRKPVIGECLSASDYYIYEQDGTLEEAKLFDKDCNTLIKLQLIAKGELDSIELFKPVYQFKPAETNAAQTIASALNFEQSGEYCVDYQHRLFQIGTFENGVLKEGKEIEVDEMMRPQKVWYIKNGAIEKVTAR